MIGEIFNALLYQPMLNVLILLYIGLKNFGLAVIVLTIIVKILIHPLNKKSIEAQKKMNELQPKIKEIQEKYKDDQQRMSIEMLSLWKLHKFNPFIGIFLLFIQLPIIIALYWVFINGFHLEQIQPALYSFIELTKPIETMFFSIDLGQPNVYIAVLAAIVQYYQAKSLAIKKEKKEEDKGKDPELAEIIQKQMTFIIPIVTLGVLWFLPSAVGLYWVTSSLVTIIEQKIVMKK